MGFIKEKIFYLITLLIIKHKNEILMFFKILCVECGALFQIFFYCINVFFVGTQILIF